MFRKIKTDFLIEYLFLDKENFYTKKKSIINITLLVPILLTIYIDVSLYATNILIIIILKYGLV